MRILRRVWLLAVLALATPGASVACSVCGGGTADNRIEFILTTALLTFMPMLLIGSIVYGLRRKYLSLAQQDTGGDVARIPRRDGAGVGVPTSS